MHTMNKRIPLTIALLLVFTFFGYAQGDAANIHLLPNGPIWPNKIVPYQIHPDFTDLEKRVIKAAMDLIEAGTCIKFRPRRSEPGHVKIFKRLPGESGVCGSELGYAKNKVHTLVLGSSRCFVPGRLLHEFMHVLGFPHEQNRGDRDKYITVNWKNMERGMELNYRKLNGRYTNAGPYDYYSILHYSLYSSAKDPLVRTLIPRQEVDESMVGQRRGFSKIDLEKLNTFYGCKQQQEPITEPREGVDNDSDADEGEGSSDDEVISVNDINKAVMSPEQMEMPTGYWETFNPQNLW